MELVLAIADKQTQPISSTITTSSSLILPRHVLILNSPLPPAPIQAVLEEDEYVATLSSIIKRDYYPLLPAPTKKPPAISIDTFQAHYTSEDNASFASLRDSHNASVEASTDRRDTHFLQLDGPPLDAYGYQGPRRLLDTIDNKSGLVAYTRFKSANDLFNFPAGAVMTHADTCSTAPPKWISHTSTRFCAPLVVGGGLLYTVPAGGASGRSAGASADTPSINGYKFLDSTPTPVVADLADSDLMTWGRVCGTPAVIPDNTPAFRMPDTPRREIVGLRLAERAARAIRSRSGAVVEKRGRSWKGTPLSTAARGLLGRLGSRTGSGVLAGAPSPFLGKAGAAGTRRERGVPNVGENSAVDTTGLLNLR